MRLFIISVCFVVMSLTSYGQVFDYLEKQFKEKPKFSLRLDTRNSFISNQAAKIRGIKFGLQYGDDIRVGMSFNWLDKKFKSSKQFLVDGELINADLDFGYIGFYFEYIFFKSKKLELSIPVQVGLGSTFMGYDKGGETVRYYQNPIIVYEPSMTANYKIWRYIGVGTGMGYRLMLINNSDVEGNFNSPVYVLKLNVYFGEMYRSVFKK
ncbi:MAG: hypothetical protein ACJAUV_001218 [Flavobacteriales bacterium]|jgi:hypothetical protein